MRRALGRSTSVICVVLASGLVFGCSQRREEPATTSQPQPEPSQPEPEGNDGGEANAPLSEVEPSPPVDGGAQAEPAEAIDLLHAVATEITVSSAYRDDLAQVARICDGDISTAWNSRSGDLVGARISISLPAEASVEGIEMTAGYTHILRGRDLFTANQRIRRVRVWREGEEVGVYPLDIETRELQRIPVSGEGGLYEIELIELVAGSRPQWSEACVSELRVMGRAPGAAARSATPALRIRPTEQPDAGPDASPDAGSDSGPEGETDAGAAAASPDAALAEVDSSAPTETEPPPGADLPPPELNEADGLRLTTIALGTAVEGGRVIDERRVFSRETDDRIYCFFRLENVAREGTRIYLHWQQGDEPISGQGREFGVTRRARFGAYAYTRADRSPGSYRCVLKTSEGSILGRIEFEVH